MSPTTPSTNFIEPHADRNGMIGIGFDPNTSEPYPTTPSALTNARVDFQVSLAHTIVAVAERSPNLRGPWIFDERELQAKAEQARQFLLIQERSK